MGIQISVKVFSLTKKYHGIIKGLLDMVLCQYYGFSPETYLLNAD